VKKCLECGNALDGEEAKKSCWKDVRKAPRWLKWHSVIYMSGNDIARVTEDPPWTIPTHMCLYRVPVR
jgi:hypothetical protein